MKDEIKEILDYFKRSNKNKLGFEQDKIITYKEANQLLDYITNLQELIKKYDFELTHKTKQYEFLRHNESKEIKRLQKLLDFEIERNDKKQEVIDKTIEMLEPFVVFDMCLINGKMIKPALDKLKGDNND